MRSENNEDDEETLRSWEFTMPLVALSSALTKSAAVMIILLSCIVVRSQTPPPTAPSLPPSKTNPCDTDQNKGLAYYFKCGKHYYDKVTAREGVRLVVGTV